MYRCIFCNSSLDAKTKPEHIIPCSIGGRKTSRTIVCSQCNADLGNEVDEPFAKSFELLRNQLNIESGSKRPPPILKNIRHGDTKICLLPGGVPQLAEPEMDVAEGHFHISVGDADRSLELVMHMLRKNGVKPGEDIRRRLSLSGEKESKYAEETIETTVSVRNIHLLRGVAKMALETFSLYHRDHAHDPRLDEVRHFIIRGDASECCEWDLDTKVPLPFTSTDLGPVFHSVSVWSSGTGAPLAAGVTLFGHFTYTVVLAEAWWGEPVAVYHAVNPLAGHLACEPDITRNCLNTPVLASDWARQRQYRPEEAAHAYEKLGALWLKKQRDALIEKVIQKARHILEPNPEEPEFISPESLQRYFSVVADGATRDHFRLPHTETLDVDEVYRRLEEEYPRFYAKYEPLQSRQGVDRD